ncbi:hypothetical protein NM688_g5446 [Phlebia brevispora]|uniref:Uncharacterized protein n=1 Tax=Phlebia brevispora TaxID=194682 RepID=A0ACC1SVF5_9APHY|nr:hypothetical protein NM688_g5446 [Phlebia brevispora]
MSPPFLSNEGRAHWTNTRFDVYAVQIVCLRSFTPTTRFAIVMLQGGDETAEAPITGNSKLTVRACREVGDERVHGPESASLRDPGTSQYCLYYIWHPIHSKRYALETYWQLARSYKQDVGTYSGQSMGRIVEPHL